MKHISFYTEPGIEAKRSFFIVAANREIGDQCQHKALSEGYRYHGTVIVQDDFREVYAGDFIKKDWVLLQ